MTKKNKNNSQTDKHKILTIVIAVAVIIAFGAYFFSNNSSQVEGEKGSEEESALAGNAKAQPNFCKGKADGTVIDKCPTKDGKQRYCKSGKTYLVACPKPTPVNLCGNGRVDAGETCSSCVRDAGCVGNDVCDNGVCVVASAGAEVDLACEGQVPANAQLCPGDDVLTIGANRTIHFNATCTADKCEYNCNAGFVMQNGQCVAQQPFCENFQGAPLSSWNHVVNRGVRTQDGEFRDHCVDDQTTIGYTCRRGVFEQYDRVCTPGHFGGRCVREANRCDTVIQTVESECIGNTVHNVTMRVSGLREETSYDCSLDVINGPKTCFAAARITSLKEPDNVIRWNAGCVTCGVPICTNSTGSEGSAWFVSNDHARECRFISGVNRESFTPTGRVVIGPGCP